MKHQVKFLLAASIVTISSLVQAQVNDEIPVVIQRSRSTPEKIDSLLSGQSVQHLISEKNLNVSLGSLRIHDEVLQEDGEAELLKKGRKVSVNLSQGKIEVSGIIKASDSSVDLSKYTSEQQLALGDLLKNGFYISYTLSECRNTIFTNSETSEDKLLVVCNKVEKMVRNSKSQNISNLAPKKSDKDVAQQRAVISFTGAKLSKDQIPALKKISGKTMIRFKSETSETLSPEELNQLVHQGLVNEEFNGSEIVQISGASVE